MRNIAVSVFILCAMLWPNYAQAQDAPVAPAPGYVAQVAPAEFHLLVYTYCGTTEDPTHRYAILALVDLEEGEYVYFFEEDEPSTREYALRMRAGEWKFLTRDTFIANLTIYRPDNPLIRATYACGPGTWSWWLYLPGILVAQL